MASTAGKKRAGLKNATADSEIDQPPTENVIAAEMDENTSAPVTSEITDSASEEPMNPPANADSVVAEEILDISDDATLDAPVAEHAPDAPINPPAIENEIIAEDIAEIFVEAAIDESVVETAAPKKTKTRPQQPPVTPAAVAIGNVDIMTRDEIAGWAWNPLSPDESVMIEILDDDVVILSLVADQDRPDLAAGGVGTGKYGFRARTLGALFPLSRHRVRVRLAANGLDLPGSPGWIVRENMGLDRPAFDFIENVILSNLDLAIYPEDVGEALSFLLRLLNHTINARMVLENDKLAGQQALLQETAYESNLSDLMNDLVVKLSQDYAPLYFEPSEAPLVSIIIPVYNKFSYTYNCLKSIFDHPPKATFEIIIVDDCSSDETLLAGLVFSGAVRIVRNVKNLGFVLGCNAGAALAKGRFLFFLNNDTLVTDGWLDELIDTFENLPNIGIAGSKLLFENGQLQEAGGIIWRLGDGWNWGRERDPNDPNFSYLRDADWVSGAALMIETAFFNSLGGFDELYVPAYYEDTDLAFRVRAAGKRVVMQPASVITHLEGISAGTDTGGAGMKRYQVINHRKFYERWKETLLTHRFNAQHPELEAERQVKRRAYFIDDSVPTPDQDAGSNAALQHMIALMELGFKVTFLPADNMAQINPYTANLQKLGIECLYAPFYWSVEEVFRKARSKPDLVYLHRYSNASKYATMVRRYFPDSRILYNVADLHFLRDERRAALETNGVLPPAAVEQKRQELEAMRQVDCVIVHSGYEADLLTQLPSPPTAVQVVPWTVKLDPIKTPFSRRSGFAFVGGYGHPPNVDAVKHLVSDVMPLVRQQMKGATAFIVGSKVTPEIAALQTADVEIVGFVPVLADAFRRIRCTVVPLRYGAGIKGKVLESFAHGLPCIMTEIAAEGLNLPETLTWLVARTPQEMADRLTQVHEDPTLNAELSRAGLAYIEERNNAQAVKDALAAAVGVVSA